MMSLALMRHCCIPKKDRYWSCSMCWLSREEWMGAWIGIGVTSQQLLRLLMRLALPQQAM